MEALSMRMLVLGAGLQGSACAFDLLGNPAVERVILADLEPGELAPFLARYRDDPRLTVRRADARDRAGIAELLGQSDACMNALPYYFNFDIARAAVDAGVHCCDLGGNTEIVFRQLDLGDAAAERGVSVVPDCGLAPGMVNILAADGIRALDRTDVVRIRVGGLPQRPEPPLDYQIVYSLEGVLDYYTTESWVLRDGRPLPVEALTEIEAVEFPAPVGLLEAFHTAGGLSTQPWTYEGRIPTMEYKTLRYPGHAERMRVIRELGLLELEPVELRDGTRVRPRDVFIACAEPRLRQPDGRDLVALRVEVEGEREGHRRRLTYDLLDYFDEDAGISAMERTTGFSLSITGQMQADGRIVLRGAATPDQCVPAEAYMAELARRGIEIRKEEE
jgi:lysine 6-dehydrogenase